MIVLGTIAIVVVVIVLGVLADRRWGILPRPAELRDAARPKPPAYAAGAAPATAIRTTRERLAKLRGVQRCANCRSVLEPTSEDRVRYADRELLVIELYCARCDARRPLYVDVAPAG